MVQNSLTPPGGAFLQTFNDNLRKNSQDLTDLTQQETTRLLKEREASILIANDLDSKNKKMNEQRDQSNASKEEVEKKLKEVSESHEQKTKELQEYQTKTQQSYDLEVEKLTQELNSQAQQLSEKFKTTWEEQDQKIKTILEEIKESNKQKIIQLFKDIDDLPNRIFRENAGKD